MLCQGLVGIFGTLKALSVVLVCNYYRYYTLRWTLESACAFQASRNLP